jgi:hypothetical protein
MGTIENVSAELFDAWLLPFEATILLLTIAAVGTVALARFGPTARNEQSPESRAQSPDLESEVIE